MKTLFKTYTQAQARSKAQDYEKIYGCDFTFYKIGDGWRVLPCITRETKPLNKFYVMDVLSVLELNTGYGKSRFDTISFAHIAEKSGLSISMVLGICKHLINENHVRPDVGRSGKIVAIHDFIGSKK